ncbi:hypothetical protein LNV08_22300 [Paucibacter sp. TC2R-5]|uniref:hypothetical protein n=1 Tax=Paucibacter sp. TC2R-5 TaxID=2893555 RepID=UPI0021E417CE|nr:hypothetical protein [Paucibacter sp. TC2R-5]MCV2361702.1 hypothetical protein [Paucibacter sp. TC2R-5]
MPNSQEMLPLMRPMPWAQLSNIGSSKKNFRTIFVFDRARMDEAERAPKLYPMKRPISKRISDEQADPQITHKADELASSSRLRV